MGGDWQQWHVQAGDVGADGPAEGYEGLWVGIEFGAANDDQVSPFRFPAAVLSMLLASLVGLTDGYCN